MVKQRETSRWIKERKDSNGNLLCLIPVCNNLRRPHKRIKNVLTNYCDEHSFRDMKQFTSWRVLRRQALKRDKKTCIKCGVRQHKKLFRRMKSNLIIDHIIPIALGGDEWDINNLQTLCVDCNKEKTSRDIKRIAILRAEEKVIMRAA